VLKCFIVISLYMCMECTLFTFTPTPSVYFQLIGVCIYLFIYFFLSTGDELRFSCLLVMYSTIWSSLPALFSVEYFQDRASSTICQDWPWTLILLISASWVAGITGVSLAYVFAFKWNSCSHTQLEFVLPTCPYMLLIVYPLASLVT
jgi:hypothetical protein